jgi:hypothetical protein
MLIAARHATLQNFGTEESPVGVVILFYFFLLPLIKMIFIKFSIII